MEALEKRLPLVHRNAYPVVLHIDLRHWPSPDSRSDMPPTAAMRRVIQKISE